MAKHQRGIRRVVLLASTIGAGLVALVWPLTHWGEVMLHYRLWKLRSGSDYAVEVFLEGEVGPGWQALKAHTARSRLKAGDVLLTTSSSEMKWRIVKTAELRPGATVSMGAPFFTFRFSGSEWACRWRQEEPGPFDVPRAKDLRNTYHILFRVSDPVQHECEVLGLVGATLNDVWIHPSLRQVDLRK